MATTAGVPLELYLHTTYEPDAEFVDGVIEERAVGENDHSAWQFAIQRWFGMHEDEWNILIRPEYRVQVAATRFRVPDVSILDASFAPDPIAVRPPLAVFEVLSPEDTVKRLRIKLLDYQAMGVPSIFVVDPESGRFEQFVDSELRGTQQFASGAIHFDLAEIASRVK
ncbi:Uma2 family endonuclease [Acidipila sp. EB88]|uniref:Uma2 family endonuclease n=1 Tax=Acidipila sp. EB88 TaxID=2305226 RepID=UPI00131509A3|nr:Uma2 family endonuclease [Acidipila sp. EB88]